MRDMGDLCGCSAGLSAFFATWWLCFRLAVAARQDEERRRQIGRLSAAQRGDRSWEAVEQEEADWLECAMMDDRMNEKH